MIARLRKGHHRVKISRAEFVRRVTWVDTNAKGYGAHKGKRNIRWWDDPNFRPGPKG